MKLSEFFVPLQKEVPHEAEIVSHQLMLKSGMIFKQASGLYSLLPLGVKVIESISRIIRKEHEKISCSEVLMPILQPASLWQESGRYDDYGKEMLKIKDRHDRDMLFGPTNEEVVTDVFRKNIKSYKDLPLNLYQIQWKFRDEIRPRFGVMRSREFLMKDAYSFDLDEEGALKSYKKYFSTYLNIFQKLGVTAIPVRADNGAIGGDLSHEFHILADTGESQVYAEQELFDNIENKNFNFEEITKFYSAADEMHDPKRVDGIVSRRGIEVGHIFNFGTKYSTAMKAQVMDESGKLIDVNMGSYGIGVSRVAAAIIESSHDDKGIIWPEEVAPFKVIVNPLKMKDDEVRNKALEIYSKLQDKDVCVLLDDRNQSPGKKFASHDLIGIPKQIIIGSRSLKEGKVEIKDRKTGEAKLVDMDKVVEFCEM